MIRAIMAVVMGALGIAAVWWFPVILFNLFVMVIACLALAEYGRIFFSDSYERWGTVIAGAIIAATMIFCTLGAEAAVLALVASIFLLSFLFVWRSSELSGIADRLGIASFGLIYLGIAFPFWSWLRDMHWGRELVLLALVPACLCDTFAYAAGKSIGRRKFAPLVSPNKTVEGFIGALAGSIGGTFLIKWLCLPMLPWHLALAFALAIWIVSPLGDLIESMLKRSKGVKDSGAVIPGHGGILDRFDALIFTGPAAYVFARYIFAL